MAIGPLSRTVSLTVALGLVSACGQRQGPPPPPQAVPVQLQQVQPANFQDQSEFVGTLEAQDRVELKPEVDGRITQVFVAPGDPVSAGQPILQLNPAQVQAELAAAQAQVSAAISSRDAARAQLEAVRSERRQAESDAQLATIEFDRTQRLVEKGALSTQDLDRARNQLEVTNARLQQIEDTRQAAQSQLEQAQATLEQARSQAVASREEVEFKQITAPISGIVGDLPHKVGDYVDRGEQLTAITQNTFLFLRIAVPAHRTPQLRVGLPVELIDPDTGDSLESGSISFISPEVDTANQSVLVKARFPNRGRLREGQYVRARLIWRATPALLVPTVAVTRIGGQSFVYVADTPTSEDTDTAQTASQRPVQLGEIQGDSYRVIDGLESGERIVVTNILKLQDGVPIQPETPASEAPSDS